MWQIALPNIVFDSKYQRENKFRITLVCTFFSGIQKSNPFRQDLIQVQSIALLKIDEIVLGCADFEFSCGLHLDKIMSKRLEFFNPGKKRAHQYILIFSSLQANRHFLFDGTFFCLVSVLQSFFSHIFFNQRHFRLRTFTEV